MRSAVSLKAAQVKYRSSDRAKVTAAAYRAKNREKMRAYQLAWCEKHRDKLRVQGAEYRASHVSESRAWRKKWRESEEGRAYHRAYHPTYYSTPKNRMRHLVTGALRRAMLCGMEHDGSLRDQLMAHPPSECACCGRSLDYSALSNGHNEAVPSLDRVDNAVGYTIANTAVVCRRCNRLKGDASLHDLVTISAYMNKFKTPDA